MHTGMILYSGTQKTGCGAEKAILQNLKKVLDKRNFARYNRKAALQKQLQKNLKKVLDKSITMRYNK